MITTVEVGEFEEAVSDLLDYHREAAKEVWPHGSILRCERCGRTQTATTGEMAKYLATGWPLCHGETMHIGDAPSN